MKFLFLFFFYLLICVEEVSTPGCKLFICCWAMARLLDVPQLGVAEADEEAIAGIAFAAAAVPEEAWPVWPSTGFLERWRPRFMCRSQYFWSATASLEHRHFFPSVRRHLPGSGSVLPEKPRWNEPHPTATILQRLELSTPNIKKRAHDFYISWRSSVDIILKNKAKDACGQKPENKKRGFLHYIQ